MSLARQFLREFRPFFRMLEEPLGRSPAYMGHSYGRSLLDDPFFHSPAALRPAIDVSEEGNNYIVEAELPGVKKENIQVRIGDGGQSLTIEGKVVDRRSAPEVTQSTGPSSESGTAGAELAHNAEGKSHLCLDSSRLMLTWFFLVDSAKAVAPVNESTQLSSERSFVGSSHFTRTVWLPRRVDPNNVSAKLEHGVLTVTIPKAQDPGSVEVQIQ